MSTPSSTYNPRRFRQTAGLYTRYRLGYPDSLIERTIACVGLKPGDPVMDLGTGPGLLAIPFAKAGMAMTAIDPEPDMIAAAKAAADEAGVAVDIRQGSSFDLPAGIGPFKLVTIGRAFHWMDRDATLKSLDTLVVPGGALAFFGDQHPPTSENAWRKVLREIGIKYGRNESPHMIAAQKPDFRTHHALLLDSPFSHLQGISEFVRRPLTADDIVGLAFSQSTSSRDRLGEKADAFESDLRAALKALSPDGQFVEIAELSALVARRP